MICGYGCPVEVKRISAQDSYPLRLKILRPGMTWDDCVYEGDQDEDLNFHLGAFVDKKLVSVCSFYFDKNDKFPDEVQYRLRGMATLEEFRGQGLSSSLLKTGFPIIKMNQATLIWCNARSSAKEFYHKVGFEAVGEEFEIEGIGPHRLMFKKI